MKKIYFGDKAQMIIKLHLFILLIFSFHVSIAHSETIVHNWDITYVMANPDGLAERRVIGVNGAWPLV